MILNDSKKGDRQTFKQFLLFELFEMKLSFDYIFLYPKKRNFFSCKINYSVFSKKKVITLIYQEFF